MPRPHFHSIPSLFPWMSLPSIPIFRIKIAIRHVRRCGSKDKSKPNLHTVWSNLCSSNSPNHSVLESICMQNLKKFRESLFTPAPRNPLSLSSVPGNSYTKANTCADQTRGQNGVPVPMKYHYHSAFS